MTNRDRIWIAIMIVGMGLINMGFTVKNPVAISVGTVTIILAAIIATIEVWKNEKEE